MKAIGPKLVIATHNAGKLREIQELLAPHGIECVGAGELGLPEPEEIGNVAAFLVSDGAPFINGECVTIDGGEWIASGGEFNGLTRMPRDGVKAALRAMRGK